MQCERCGYTFAPTENVCPLCTPNEQTAAQPGAEANRTRFLIQLDRCPYCGFIVFPTDATCTACGAVVNRAWQPRPAANLNRHADSRSQVLLGMMVLVITVASSLLVYYVLRR